MEYIKIRKFYDYQHYSDRKLVWFKWHVDCLQDYNFMNLSTPAKWLFIGLICLACKHKNAIPRDENWLKNILLKDETNTNNISNLLTELLASQLIVISQTDARPIREDKNREDKIRKETDLQKVVKAYFIKKEYKDKWEDWCKIYFRRYCKPAKQLIDYFKDYKKAVDCIDDLGSFYDKKDLTWTLDTIVKNAPDWKLKNNG